MSNPICEICRGDLENPANFCKECPQPSACRDCVIAYIEDKINSSYMGSCPAIHCPAACHVEKDAKKKRPLLPYYAWKDYLHAEAGTKYNALCSSVLAFLCGGCHTLKALDLGFESNRSNVCYTHVQKELTEISGSEEAGAAQFRELEDRLHDYCHNKYSVEEIYRYLVEEMFPALKTKSDEQAWELFSKILKMINTPERRVNLHLRYLRDRPRMKTLCCNREHCFRCKVKDYHEGKTCMESTASLDHSIVVCPQCSLSLTRGDGCNTVTCVCGKQFSWSQEKENSERCQQFLAQHPEDTSTHCAIVLCTRTPPPAPLLNQAKAWQIRNRIEVNRALTEWFKKKYWPVPSQACTTLPLEAQPDGVKEAIELWKNTHTGEVNRRRDENDRALRSIFLSLVPNESERPQMAHRLVSQTRRAMLGSLNDEKLVLSANKWIEKHREVYEHGVEDYEVRSANQFLFLYGNRLVKETFPAYTSYPSGGEWCRELSNGDLTYTNNNTTVERVGSVSCYPAAFCKLTAERCMFRVVIDQANKTSNWLTFGVARKGMANSSSDGVGRTSNSWGLSDDRSSSGNQLIVAASGTEVGRWRKFRQGDVLTASIDVVEGWAEVMVNEEEFVHRFAIPSGTMEDYVFAMSFANDHRVTILSDHPSSLVMKSKTSSTTRGELNLDHTIMYNHLRKQLRNILAVSASEAEEMAAKPNTVLPSSRLMTSGEKWLMNCAGSQEVALEMFEAMRPSIEQVLSLRPKTAETAGGEETAAGKVKAKVQPTPFESLTWNNLLEAASWYRHNREVILAQRKYDLAITFSMSYGDDAAFMAAMNLMEYHTHKVEKEIAASSIAYMQVFCEEMNAWYDYNSSLREPVIENIAKNCRCLPRHTKTCPLANKK